MPQAAQRCISTASNLKSPPEASVGIGGCGSVI